MLFNLLCAYFAIATILFELSSYSLYPRDKNPAHACATRPPLLDPSVFNYFFVFIYKTDFRQCEFRSIEPEISHNQLVHRFPIFLQIQARI